MYKNENEARPGANKVGVRIIETKSLISIQQVIPPLVEGGGLKSVGTPSRDDLQILVSAQAYAIINRHIQSDLKREVGGFLIGLPYEWEKHRYVEIVDAVEAEATSSSAGHLTISPQTWSNVQALLREKFKGLYIVGWYHTHPRMGLFLSTHDLSIHEGFFREPWHVALVADPTQQKAAFFVWDDHQLRQSNGYQIQYPTDTKESDHWSTPEPFDKVYGDATLQDFTEINTWQTRWDAEDKYLVKVQSKVIAEMSSISAIGAKGDLHFGLCWGKLDDSRLYINPRWLIDIKYIRSLSSGKNAVMDNEILMKEIQNRTQTDKDWQGIESIGYFAIVPPEIFQAFKKNVPTSTSFSEKRIFILGDGTPGNYICIWKNANGDITERNLIEVISLSELSGTALQKTLFAVKEQCEGLNI